VKVGLPASGVIFPSGWARSPGPNRRALGDLSRCRGDAASRSDYGVRYFYGSGLDIDCSFILAVILSVQFLSRQTDHRVLDSFVRGPTGLGSHESFQVAFPVEQEFDDSLLVSEGLSLPKPR
jgi:hypothetical protein